jgi:hypothetical protein
MPNSNSSPTTESSIPSISPNLVDADGGDAGTAPVRPRSGFIRTGAKKRWSYNWTFARLDAQAGITVAAISLPQSMAYALIAGVDPRFGLYSAMIFTALGSIFGSSSHLINGPTGAVSLVLRDAQKQGFTVFLAGIRADLRRGMERLGFAEFFPPDRWFFEQERERDSATLKAVRHAYQLLGIQRPTDTVAYYLV